MCLGGGGDKECVCVREREREKVRVDERVCVMSVEHFLCVVDVVNPKADKQMTPSYSEEVEKNLKKRVFTFLTLSGHFL